MNMRRDLSSCFVENRLTGLGRVVALLAIILSSLALAADIINVSGWWTILEDPGGGPSGGPLEIRQQGADLTMYDFFGNQVAQGKISNDTVFFLIDNSTFTGIFEADTIRGTGPDGPFTLVRTSGPNWAPVGCRAITIDGNTSDWSGLPPAVDDPDNDATGNPSTEIDRVFISHDQTYLYIRIDFIGAADPEHSGESGEYHIHVRGPLQDYHLSLRSDFTFRLNGPGQDLYLDPPAYKDHTVEAKVRLAVLDNLPRGSFFVQSRAPWAPNGVYDEARFIAKFDPCQLCGDFDGSNFIGISDVVYFTNWMFTGGPAPVDGSDGDINCDQRPNLGDAVYLVNYIFRGGLAPCAECSRR